MQLTKLIKNSRGSAQLVAVIAAAGISSVIMLSNAQMLTTFNKQNKQVLTANIALDLRKQVEAFMTNPLNCRKAFRLKNVNGTTTELDIETTPFLDVNDNPQFQPGDKYDNDLLTYVGWSINNTTTVIEEGPPDTRMIVDLNLFLADTEGKQVIRTIKLETKKIGGPNSPIDECLTASVGNAEKWTRFPGGVDIFNSELGDVGMFLSSPFDPQYRVDLAGTATFTETLRQNSVINSGPTTVDRDLFAPETNTTTHIGGPWGSSRLNVTGNAFISGNLPTSNIVAQNLSSVTTTETDGNLTVQQLATFGPTGGTGTRLQHYGPVYFNANNADPEVTPDQRIHGAARFNNPVASTSTVSVGGAPLFSNHFSVYGNSSVTGMLSTLGPYTGNDSLCINGNCRTTFAEQSCPSGAGMWRLNVDGTIQCANMNCPTGSLFKGLDGSGNAICEALPTTFCPPGQYLQSINTATGARVCRDVDPQVDVMTCGAPDANGRVSSVLRGISGGNPMCTAATITPDGQSCPVGTVAGGFNPDGTVSSNCIPPAQGSPLTCPIGQVAAGMNANGSPICRTAFDPTPCPAQSVARGIASDGTLICEPVSHLIGGSCGGSAVAIGLTNTGTPQCGCTAEVMTWVENGNVCDANLPASAPGSVVATDSAAPTTGSATFTCTTSGWNMTASSPVCSAPATPAPPTWTTANFGGCGSTASVGDACSPASSWLYPTPPSLYDYCACSSQRPNGTSAPSGQVSLHGYYCGSDGRVMISDTTDMGPCI